MTMWNVRGPHTPKNVVSCQGFRTVLPNRILTMAANYGSSEHMSLQIQPS